jgi:hypothetical protein
VSEDTKNYIDERIRELNYKNKLSMNRTDYINKLIELDREHSIYNFYVSDVSDTSKDKKSKHK